MFLPVGDVRAALFLPALFLPVGDVRVAPLLSVLFLPAGDVRAALLLSSLFCLPLKAADGLSDKKWVGDRYDRVSACTESGSCRCGSVRQ